MVYKAKRGLLAITAALACITSIYIVHKAIYRPWIFRAFSDGKQITSKWTTSVSALADSEPKEFVFSLRHSTGKTVEVDRLRNLNLGYTLLNRNGKAFLLTKFAGGGTSGAYYYSVIEISSDKVHLVPAIARYTAYKPNAEDCLPNQVESPEKEPTFIFGDCGEPFLDGDRLVFRMRGFHCSIFQSGGCPSREEVALK